MFGVPQQKRKQFFFEKKNQKTFDSEALCGSRARALKN
jgi:hypothetical protein